MTEVVGIRFKRAGAVYYYDRSGVELKKGDSVVVESAEGQAIGEVVIAPREVATECLPDQLKPVLRRTSDEDVERMAGIKTKEQEALATCQEMVAKHGLRMKPLDAEYDLEANKFTIYFNAEERVDFRAMLRELSSALKTHVELRQLGARDVAKLVGGFGRCGRQLCCASHLTKFDPISMKMAKEQDLPLNPAKISGMCGRLLCCLAYECNQYQLLKKNLPAIGKRVKTPHGEAKVIGRNPLKETILVQLESEATMELPVAQIGLRDGGCGGCPQDRPQT